MNSIQKPVKNPSLATPNKKSREYSQSMRAHAETPLEKRIGTLLRQTRKRAKLTLSDMAKGSDISTAMLSRIETGQASASLDVLARYASALGVPLSTIFSQIETPQSNAQFVKNNEGMEVIRMGTEQAGYNYKILSYNFGPEKLFDPYIIDMDENSRSYSSFQHEGTEFLHMLKGKMEYRYGDHLYLMRQGDSLTFAAEVEHGPEQLLSKHIRFLVIFIYGNNSSNKNL